MHTPKFAYKFSIARAGTELCGLCMGIPGFKLIVGFHVLKCIVALLGIRCLRAFALLSLRPRSTNDVTFFFFSSVLPPFQDYFSSYETGQSVGGRKRENPEKKHLAHPQAELGLSNMWPVRGWSPHGVTCALFNCRCASLLEYNFYTNRTNTCLFVCLN